MARSRGRRRRNPLGLSKKQLVGVGVGGAALVGTLGYLFYRSKKAAAATGCWQPVTGPFTLTPGHYRMELPIPADQQAQVPAQFAQLPALMQQLHTALPGMKVGGVWFGSLAWPTGTPLPTDWPNGPNPGVLRVDILNAYSTAGTSNAGKTPPAGTRLWKCSTGPTPALQALPSDLATILAQLAAGAQTAGLTLPGG